jgi:hypothetical protein
MAPGGLASVNSQGPWVVASGTEQIIGSGVLFVAGLEDAPNILTIRSFHMQSRSTLGRNQANQYKQELTLDI